MAPIKSSTFLPSSLLDPPSELELPRSELTRLLALVSQHVCDINDAATTAAASTLDTVNWDPKSHVDAVELVRSLAKNEDRAPEEGVKSPEGFDDLLKFVCEKATAYGELSYGINHTGPGMQAFIPGGGLLQTGLADLVGNALNSYVGLWVGSPGMVQLETNVIKWFTNLIGYPTTGFGSFSSGGSTTNWSATVCARRRRFTEEEGFTRAVAYASDQAHMCVVRGCVAAGIPARNVRRVPTDRTTFRMQVEVLEAMIVDDIANGWAPFLVVANAGSTNTGAVDDLNAIAKVVKKHPEVWFHVDACYGGCFIMTDRGRELLRGIECSDSVSLDLHKSLFLPHGTGLLLVRDAEYLRYAFSDVNGEYLPRPEDTKEDDLMFPSFCDFSLELTRPVRGLRVWLPLKMHGLGTFRRYLDEKWDLARWAWKELASIALIERVTEPQISVLSFRWKGQGKGMDGKRRDAMTLRLMAHVNKGGKVFLANTRLPEWGVVVRICVLHYRTHLEHMKTTLEEIRSATEAVLREQV
ncbi:putative decarboxylase [Jimgerdemannia flammicorona]|uniref:Putative decarboxylase n=1 Tax=Jimgerdemannia flammicorona TaxID=994334 RepID=A0A433QPU4_9FUNG|nr:putative decarboxylase [Jimgerdemannia flammicorona]